MEEATGSFGVRDEYEEVVVTVEKSYTIRSERFAPLTVKRDSGEGFDEYILEQDEEMVLIDGRDGANALIAVLQELLRS